MKVRITERCRIQSPFVRVGSVQTCTQVLKGEHPGEKDRYVLHIFGNYLIVHAGECEPLTEKE